MSLTKIASEGWATGFRNLFNKEMASWWRTRRWVVHLVLWQVVIGGFVFLVTWEGRREQSPTGVLEEAMDLFFQAGGFFSLIGAILVTQGAIVGERRSGTAAWVLTKPTSRASFVLSKLVAITLSFLFLSLALPAASVLVITKLVLGVVPVMAHYLEAVGILALHQLFYIALTLMLGTFFRTRGPVAGAALGFWLAGNILPSFSPPWLMTIMPWMLARAAAAIAIWKPLSALVWMPVLATAGLGVGFVVVALWRFRREEF